MAAGDCNIEKVDILGCLIDEATFKDMVDRLCALEAATDLDEQTLTNNDAGGVTTSISISNGNTIPINHPADVAQTLAIDCNTDRLTISGGNTVDLTCCPTWTTIAAPTITATGSATLTLSQVLETDRWWYMRWNDCAKREVYQFQYRTRVTQSTDNTWAIIDVPNIAGWDRRIYDIGTYRQNGNLNNPDNDTQGAMPDAPYMGAEAHEWSNAGRIYLNQINSKDNSATIWVEFIAEYKRN